MADRGIGSDNPVVDMERVAAMQTRLIVIDRGPFSRFAPLPFVHRPASFIVGHGIVEKDAVEIGPLDQLRADHGAINEAEGFKYSDQFKPSAIFKPKKKGR